MQPVTDRELKDIAEYVKRLEHHTGEKAKHDLIYEWVKTSRITRHQHMLLCRFVFQSQSKEV